MDAKKLQWIKKRQAEYKELFGETLIVDFPRMVLYSDKFDFINVVQKNIARKITDEPLKFLQNLLEKYNLTFEDITERKNKNRDKVLMEFAIMVCKKPWNISQCAILVNLDRTALHYYKDLEKSRLIRNEYYHRIVKQKKQIKQAV